MLYAYWTQILGGISVIFKDKLVRGTHQFLKCKWSALTLSLSWMSSSSSKCPNIRLSLEFLNWPVKRKGLSEKNHTITKPSFPLTIKLTM